MSRHFVLVHGANHGAWCWYKVATILESAGHKVTALDMAASGLHPSHAHQVNSVADYAQPLMDFFQYSFFEKVVLVGHSMAGNAISFAMQNYPDKISVAVFLAATMPAPNNKIIAKDLSPKLVLPAIENADLKFDITKMMKFSHGNGPNNPATGVLLTQDYLKSNFYNHSPPEDLKLGSTLWRSLPVMAMSDKGFVLTEDKYGLVSRVYIICDPEEDAWWQDIIIIMNPPKEVKRIDGSDHMAMFSKPNELCDLLEEIGAKYT